MKNKLVPIAALMAMTAILLGAMGAHALEKFLTPSSLDSYKTAVRYQMWHALALLIFGFHPKNTARFRWVFILWLAGIVLFSGSIYLLSTQEATGLALGFLGPVTPIGGALLIAGWALLFVQALQKKPTLN